MMTSKRLIIIIENGAPSASELIKGQMIVLKAKKDSGICCALFGDIYTNRYLENYVIFQDYLADN
jgi:hypothetical protein